MMARFIASGGGAGYAPIAPGTAGSLVGLGLGALAMLGPPLLLPILAWCAIMAGWAAIPRVVTDPEADPGWVVIDEIGGQLFALMGLNGELTPLGLLAAFALFRLLDITKPGPIGWADRKPGAVGIMADDVIAGAIASVILVVGRAALHDLHWT